MAFRAPPIVVSYQRWFWEKMWTLQQWLLLIHHAEQTDQNTSLHILIYRAVFYSTFHHAVTCHENLYKSQSVDNVWCFAWQLHQRPEKEQWGSCQVKRQRWFTDCDKHNSIGKCCNLGMKKKKKKTCISCLFACDRNMSIDHMNHVKAGPPWGSFSHLWS